MALSPGFRLGAHEIVGLLGADSTPVITSPTFAFGQSVETRRTRAESNPVIGRRQGDMMPDGRVIGYMSAGVSAESTNDIFVVLNWFNEVRQRVPRPN